MASDVYFIRIRFNIRNAVWRSMSNIYNIIDWTTKKEDW